MKRVIVQFDNTRLKYLVPIKQLLTEQRQQIANQLQFVELRTGDELYASQEANWFVYLIEGKLDLMEINSMPVLIHAEDERALYPLFNESAHNPRFIAQGPCIVVRCDKKLFNTFVDQELVTAEHSETVVMNEVESNLYHVITHDFNMGKLRLFSSPEVMLKIKKALARKNTRIEDVMRIVSADPAMVVRLISIANELLTQDEDSVSSIEEAIARIGLQNSIKLITDHTGKALFVSKSKLLNQRLLEYYDDSMDIATIGYALAKQSGMLSPKYLILAGLMHEIGVICILGYIEETGLIVHDKAELDEIVMHLRQAVSEMVIRHWKLPEDFLPMVGGFENWQRFEEGDIDTCDMIIIAQIYRRLKYHQLDDLPKINQVPAFKKLYPANQQADFAQNVFQHAHEELSTILQLLKM